MVSEKGEKFVISIASEKSFFLTTWYY